MRLYRELSFLELSSEFKRLDKIGFVEFESDPKPGFRVKFLDDLSLFSPSPLPKKVVCTGSKTESLHPGELCHSFRWVTVIVKY